MADAVEQPESDLNAQWAAWRVNPSPQANASMLRALDPAINKSINAHVGSVNPINRGHARALALQSLHTYDPKRSSLPTHVYHNLKSLKRYTAQAYQGLHVPEGVSLDRLAVARSNQQLTDELGREPTEDELADHSGFSVKRIRRVQKFNPGINSGLLAGMGEEGSPYDPAVNQGQSPAWVDLVKGDLDPRDQKIMEYAQRNMENQEIAAKLRVSPGLVSQRKMVIQKLLDQESELSPF